MTSGAEGGYFYVIAGAGLDKRASGLQGRRASRMRVLSTAGWGMRGEEGATKGEGDEEERREEGAAERDRWAVMRGRWRQMTASRAESGPPGREGAIRQMGSRVGQARLHCATRLVWQLLAQVEVSAAPGGLAASAESARLAVPAVALRVLLALLAVLAGGVGSTAVAAAACQSMTPRSVPQSAIPDTA